MMSYLRFVLFNLVEFELFDYFWRLVKLPCAFILRLINHFGVSLLWTKYRHFYFVENCGSYIDPLNLVIVALRPPIHFFLTNLGLKLYLDGKVTEKAIWHNAKVSVLNWLKKSTRGLSATIPKFKGSKCIPKIK